VLLLVCWLVLLQRRRRRAARYTAAVISDECSVMTTWLGTAPMALSEVPTTRQIGRGFDACMTSKEGNCTWSASSRP